MTKPRGGPTTAPLFFVRLALRDQRWTSGEIRSLAAVLFDPVTRRAVTGFVLVERRHFDLAARERDRAARVEAAARRRVHRRRDVAGQDDALAAPFDDGIRDRDRGE